MVAIASWRKELGAGKPIRRVPNLSPRYDIERGQGHHYSLEVTPAWMISYRSSFTGPTTN